MMNKRVLKSIIMFILMLTLTTSVFAASGYQGYIVYREGSSFNPDWHTAIVVEPSLIYDSYPIVHARGSSYYANVDTWSHFLNGEDYIGLYTVNGIYTSSDRDVIIEDALWLTEYDIPYTWSYQLDYNINSGSGNYVMPSIIDGIRCDGVVEYIFELNNFRIFGSDSDWDISYKSSTNKSAHSTLHVAPSIQAGCLIYCHNNIQ